MPSLSATDFKLSPLRSQLEYCQTEDQNPDYHQSNIYILVSPLSDILLFIPPKGE
jgi:hypothetical protein